MIPLRRSDAVASAILRLTESLRGRL